MTICDMTKYVNKFLHVRDMTKLQYSILQKKKFQTTLIESGSPS